MFHVYFQLGRVNKWRSQNGRPVLSYGPICLLLPIRPHAKDAPSDLHHFLHYFYPMTFFTFERRMIIFVNLKKTLVKINNHSWRNQNDLLVSVKNTTDKTINAPFGVNKRIYFPRHFELFLSSWVRFGEII